MNYTEYAFSKKQLTVLTIVLFVLAGLMTYFTMPRAENPLYTVRTARVVTYWPGASPERVEMLVTDKLEKRIQEIPELDYIKSESKTGVSVVTVYILDQYKNMRPIWDNLRRKVEDAERELPADADKPIVNDEFGDIFGIVFSIVWDGYTYADIKDIADDLRDELLTLSDVAKVDLLGVQDERVFIDYNNDKLRELSLSPEQLESILRERNIIQSGGLISKLDQQIAIEPTGNYVNVDDIRSTLIKIPGTNNIIKLEDIANVYRGYIDPPEQLMHTTGKPSLGLAISMREGGNILILGEQVKEVLERYQAHYPIGIEFRMLAYQPDRVIAKIDDFVSNLIQAVIIVCLVMFAFLGLRTGVIVASLIPVVIMVTFVAMSVMDIGLNQITLAALIIALGMLVDNAIVMSESIIVQMQKGKEAVPAAIDSSKELKTPLLMSSLTTSAAFLPFCLAKSGTGEYVGSLFLVVTSTLLASWLISLTMIPLFCVFLLKVKEKKETKGKLAHIYRAFLLFLLKARYLTLVLVIGFFVFSIYLMGFVPKIFYPPSDTPMFTAELELPVGSSIYHTERVIKQVEDYVLNNLMITEERPEGVVSFSIYMGNGGPRFRLQHDPEPPNPHYAFSLYTVTSFQAIPEITEKLEKYIHDNFPDIKPRIRPLEEGTPVKNPVEIRITGKDEEKLFDYAEKVKDQLEVIPGTKDVVDDWGQKIKKIVINVDQARAKRAQITNSDIAKSIESVISGVSLSEYREDDKLIPIILRSEVAKDVDLIGTEAFNVYSQSTGESVPLQQVATIDVVWEPAIIFRRNRLPTVTVSSNLKKGYTASEIEKEIVPLIKTDSESWPLGYKWELGGENEESSKAQRSIFVELPVAALAIIFLLMLQFNSIKKVSIILLTIPMSVIGVVLGLLIMRSYFGIMTILGMISLAGIVINNAIVLIDRIRIEKEENNLDDQAAIITAAEQRTRPILLTTITTISSLVPLYLGGGPLWESMAIAIMFGLLIATFLTLGLVPVLYSLLFKISYRGYQLNE